MWLDEAVRGADKEKMKRLDLEKFGEIMDEFIQKSKVGIAVTKEEESEKWTVHGAGCGAVMDFYIFLNALEPIFLNMLDEMEKVGGIMPEKLAETLCDVVEKSLIEAANKRKKSASKAESQQPE